MVNTAYGKPGGKSCRVQGHVLSIAVRYTGAQMSELPSKSSRCTCSTTWQQRSSGFVKAGVT